MTHLKRENLRSKLWYYIQYFSQHTTLHGFNIIGLPNLHWSERLFWFLMVVISAGGAISLTISNWNRYSANPTVISIQKDYRNWRNHIPAVTGCFNNKMDPEKAEKYIYKKWHKNKTDSDYEYYLNLLQLISNASYENFEYFKKYKDDESLLNIDMAQIVLNIHPQITGRLLTVDKSREFKWNLILIELGMCFTFFSKFARILSLRNKENPNETQEIDHTLLLCHYLNGLCYARFDSDPRLPIKYYVHSYLETPDISVKQYHALGKGSDMEIDYRAIETQPSPDIKYLNPVQRNCRYDHEPINDIVPVYSVSICQMICRYNLAMNFCGCKPFFYHFFEGTTCNISGLICLSKYKERLTKNPKEMGCKCPQTCHFINYLPDTPKLSVWDSGVYFDQRTTFRWGLQHPTTKYRRDIIFGFGDLIVSIGGTLNLFLGMSFITIIEAFFLIFGIIANSLSIDLRRKKLKRKKLQMKNNKIAPLVIYYIN